ncbi:MAG: hypothetical protein H7835_12590, partial [Magnetococcus sp. XQGC-1]
IGHPGSPASILEASRDLVEWFAKHPEQIGHHLRVSKEAVVDRVGGAGGVGHGRMSRPVFLGGSQADCLPW